MSQALAQIIKSLAAGQMQANRPMNICYGTVLTEEPNLSIQIEQKRVLTKEFLVLTRHVTDHNVDMTVDHMTEDTDTPNTENKSGGQGDAAFMSHNHAMPHKHPYKGRKTFLVHEKLLAGEKVVLASMQGGQEFIVLDRIWSNLDAANGQ